MGSNDFDVAVIGAGPAGTTAANSLAKLGRSVVLFDKAVFPRPSLCAGWLNSRAESVLHELNVTDPQLLKTKISDVTFYSADLAKSARPKLSAPVGFLIDRRRLDDAMLKAARTRGITFESDAPVESIRRGESTVTINLPNGKSHVSRLLILACGRDSALVQRMGFASRPGDGPIWCTQVETPLPRGSAGDPGVAVILGLGAGASFGFFIRTPEKLVLNVNWMREESAARPALVELAKVAFERGLIPVDLSAVAAKADVVRSPAAAALDMETHAGKHTLLIGDAGGFVAAASNEGIYPAMWSAQLAAQVVDDALRSTVTQDALMNFDTIWRTKMADYLRPPQTDIRFLLPLVFSNQPMADRMGAAFFFGENM